jgi:hypothetical protein
MRLKIRGRDKLKNRFMGVKSDQILSKTGVEKNRRFVIFWCPFLTFWTDFVAIGIYRKTGPTKSTVLGPRPPPWEIYKIYRFFAFFTVLGAFNRAGKSVTKIGIYSKPPPKSEFYRFFIISRPNFVPRQLTIVLKVPDATFNGSGSTEFFWFLVFFFLVTEAEHTRKKH